MINNGFDCFKSFLFLSRVKNVFYVHTDIKMYSGIVFSTDID
jgi:hypothetical protein